MGKVRQRRADHSGGAEHVAMRLSTLVGQSVAKDSSRAMWSSLLRLHLECLCMPMHWLVVIMFYALADTVFFVPCPTYPHCQVMLPHKIDNQFDQRSFLWSCSGFYAHKTPRRGVHDSTKEHCGHKDLCCGTAFIVKKSTPITALAVASTAMRPTVLTTEPQRHHKTLRRGLHRRKSRVYHIYG